MAWTRAEAQQTETRAQIENQLESLEKSWKKVVSVDRINRMELQQALQASQAKLDKKLSAIEETLNSIKNKTKFKLIGSRYFYIEHVEEQSWTNASNSCQKIGGRLASIHNEKEFNNIVAELNSDISYMLGISDLAEKGVFISKSTGEKAPFLKWKPGEPRYENPKQHCVTVHDGGMWVDDNKTNTYDEADCQNDALQKDDIETTKEEPKIQKETRITTTRR
ncbi:accessory gland protein Acp29AB-like [Drosophila ficusphila]|uniref:accessory gland protein Acp29AB-like n=1 Tax=Drosophila ficusphila TaxID=30025 RepID=UPI001C88E818|nr:accessory gland protein Acp29AB-like [Drosophila ficusphila]